VHPLILVILIQTGLKTIYEQSRTKNNLKAKHFYTIIELSLLISILTLRTPIMKRTIYLFAIALFIAHLTPAQDIAEATTITNNQGIQKAFEQFEYQTTIEDSLQEKLERILDRIVGPDNYEVVVTAKLNWISESQESISIEVNSPAPISEKSYTELSRGPSIKNPPGVHANVESHNHSNAPRISEKTYTEASHSSTISGPPGVSQNKNPQDSGIGADTTIGTETEEVITNYQYPWFKTVTDEPSGTIQQLSVAVLINYKNDSNGNLIPYTKPQLHDIEKLLCGAINIPIDKKSPCQLVLINIPFVKDDTP
jgi:flagellar M-ring protein FliF